ncbi:hypothetical protein NKG05_16235 [Oerskovia sp. M15]
MIGRPVSATATMACAGHELWHPNPDFYYATGAAPVRHGPLLPDRPRPPPRSCAGRPGGGPASPGRTDDRQRSAYGRAGARRGRDARHGPLRAPLRCRLDAGDELRRTVEPRDADRGARRGRVDGGSRPEFLLGRRRGASWRTRVDDAPGPRRVPRVGARLRPGRRGPRAGPARRRASADVAMHVLDTMETVLRAARGQGRLEVATTCVVPSLVPLSD